MATKRLTYLLVLLLYFLAQTHFSNGQDYRIPFISVQSCAETQFFDIGGLICRSCGEAMIASSDGLSCQCQTGYKELPDSAVRGIEISCEACAGDEVATRDGQNCIKCGNGLVNPATGACPVCGDRDIRVEYELTGALLSSSDCRTCDTSKEPDADVAECVSCHQTFAGDCSCVDPNVLSGGICFSEGELVDDLPDNYRVPFESATDDGFVDSWFFNQYYRSVQSLCNSAGNFTACQLLGNLCVMVDYNEDDYEATCTAYNNIGDQQTDVVNDILAAKHVKYLRGRIQHDRTFQRNFSCPRRETSDLWFEDLSGDQQLYAIPVLVDTLKKFNVFVNRATPNNWQLTRRFFLVDNVSGKTAADAPASIVRYASEIELVITLQNEEGQARNGRIYPPLLKIKYSELTQESDYQGDTSTTVVFKVTYTMDQSGSRRGLSITLGVLSALAVIHGLVKSNAWRRRTGLIYIDIKTMFKFVAFSCGLLANVFFAVIFGYSLYWLLFFKAFDLVHLFAVQCSTDIFLIDWERSRGRLVQANDAAITKGMPAPVSIWRTYFVANEWNELQATRKSHTGLQLLVMLFLLEVVGLVHLTTTDPIGSVNPDPNAYYGGYDVILRFAVATGIYLLIAAVQWIYFTFIYERFVEDILQNFVDLCSMANENLVGQRGLLPNTDQQTFELLLQNKFRENYSRILQPLNLTRAEQQRANQAQSNRSGTKVDTILEAYGTMNKFLSAFIDHGMRDIDYLVKDKLLLEKILDMEFYDPVDKGFLFNDDGHSFDQALFFGHESTLLLFELLLFCVVDLMFQNYLLAGIVTYIISIVLSMLRSSFGRYNLAKKTLVDERFLI
ncbi:putative meckelin [Apostichopus japonicus]|uniref:Putative meckelin n=1 Tax=Stichopus japonicus TaxID=307972 RepID=A0A2G8JUK3_STIJA|nr:putative meckelin [Apostichopus japonicus]